MSKDWSGNGNSVWKTLGASSHTDKERAQHDYYATDPIAIDKLVKAMRGNLRPIIWEPACGEGHLCNRLYLHGHKVIASDIVDRGYQGTYVQDFLQATRPPIEVLGQFDIVTNPPYKYATEFVLHALEVLPDYCHCCMFLKTSFLEGKRRREKLFNKYPPKYVLQFSERVLCAKNGEFDGMRAAGGSAVAYAWFVWEKGWEGETTVRWI